MRAFVAVDVTSKAAISKLQDEISSEAGWDAGAVKPVEPGNFHFTLFFLGEIAAPEVERIRARLSSLRFRPFDVTYVGVGAFPRPQSARVVWVGVDEAGEKGLSGLARDVTAALSELGYVPDKPFSPHLTVFRVKSRQPVNLSEFARRYKETQLGRDRVEMLHLKQSELTPRGPVYSNVYTVEALR
jgi:2'-5' RNA ligase